MIPELERAYAFDDNAVVISAAVGILAETIPYGVAQRGGKDLVVPYGKDWPVQRAATGVSSAGSKHVKQWPLQYYRGKEPIRDLIEAVFVETVDVDVLLARAKLFRCLDVLQVDTEGFDDDIIYAASLDTRRPVFMNLEVAHLGQCRSLALKQYLSQRGYSVFSDGLNALSIRSEVITDRGS